MSRNNYNDNDSNQELDEEGQTPLLNVFDATRKSFHDLRGTLSGITGSVDLIRNDESGTLSNRQIHALDIITRTAHEMTDHLEQVRTMVLRGLATAPATGRIWESACRIGHDIRQDILERDLIALRNREQMSGTRNVILVADPESLTQLRRAFVSKSWRIRTATSPSDIQFLTTTEKADLITMAPPLDETGEWWYQLRITLYGTERMPALLHAVVALPG